MKTSSAIAAAFFLTLPAGAQPAQEFEVASIKEAPAITAAMAAAGTLHVGVRIDGGQVDIGYTPLSELIRMAYDVRAYQVSGPAWMAERKWDIAAKLPSGATRDQSPPLLRALLAERFGLRAHRETSQRQVYALLVARPGKLQPAPEAEGQSDPLQVDTSRDGRSTTVTGAGRGVTRTEMQPDGSMVLASTNMTMPLLADALAYYLDLPVMDRTQLPGGYIVKLEFSAADLRFAAAKAGAGAYFQASPDEALEPSAATLIDSIQKLGLRLEKQQEPIEMIVVDAAERTPSAN